MEKVIHILESSHRSLLCVGPLSQNIVEAAADLSEEISTPLVLIASRRQVDAEALGRGYVNNWSTEAFSESVRRLGRGDLLLARDHGGPGQGNNEALKNAEEWMKAAKKSFLIDIECGIHFLHLDTSAVPANGGVEKNISLLLELYGFVQEQASLAGKKIFLEVGIEEHSGLAPDPAFLRHFLEIIHGFCQKNHLATPLFAAAQTGSRVEEMRNVGAYSEANEHDREKVAKLIREASEVCRSFHCYLKEHNTDYLSSESLALRPRLGIKAVNVAPEFGVAETKSLLQLMHELGCEREFEEFAELVLASRKWEKWLQQNSQASDQERVMIAGHYCFSDPKAIEIKARVARAAEKKDIHLDSYLRQNISRTMRRYASALGLAGHA